jgi:pimeloyl-ACP methyl ester carboxylesterase
MLTTETLHPTVRECDGLRIRCADTGGDALETVLLLHPWPESLFAWETIWPLLAPHARLVAIDLPGFGGSERRDDLLSPRAMAGFLVRLMHQWDLDGAHVIGPDVGTGATLFAADLEPGLLRSAVVGSGASAWPLQVTGALEDIIKAPSLDGVRAVDAATLVEEALTGIERHTLPAHVRADYLASYAGDRFAESARYVRAYPEDLRVLAERLAHINIPVQIIAGGHDGLVPPSNAEFLHDHLPHSRLHILDTGHFAWEDAAPEYATLVTDWIDSGYLE